MKTVAESLVKLETEIQTAMTRLDWRKRILGELPANLPCPTVSNETLKEIPNAWLSFSRDYGDTWESADILATLENAGFVPVPATLAKYGDWRRTVKAGLQNDIPEESSRSKLVDSEPIAPLWIVPEQHTGTRAIAFYKGPSSGLVYRVCVPGPQQVYLTARKIEYKGGWRYESNSAKLTFPDEWHAVTDEALTPIAQVSQHSRAYRDTEQGLSGAVYFSPFLDQREFPLTPSQFMRQLGF